MPNIAIPGGTSRGLGRHIVRGILKLQPEWKITILSRTTSPIPYWLQPLLDCKAVSLRKVDYKSHESLVKALSDIHTVVSTLIYSEDMLRKGQKDTTQLDLLAAAKEAGVKRFVPSEFGFGIHAGRGVVAMEIHERVWQACAKSGLECARYCNGAFLNYLGQSVKDPALKEEALGGKDEPKDVESIYWMHKCYAEVPVREDGSSPMLTFTSMEDIGRFVAMSLSMEKWPPVLDMAGDTCTFLDVVKAAEEVMGKKYTIKEIKPQVWQDMFENTTDIVDKMWPEMFIMYNRNEPDAGFIADPILNKTFPEIKPMNVKAYLERYYGRDYFEKYPQEEK